ncbi:DUF2142 domain-containing protein [Curtobacterium sp. 24E2]|nr:DUF2142 domain-containing protein [Curtobacterium sp. 24E2]
MQHAPHPVVTRSEAVRIAVLTATFGLWLVLWALVVPAFQAPDEPAHFDAALHVATGSGWPAPGTLHVSNAVRAAQQEQASGEASSWSTVDALLAAHPGDSETVDQMTQHPPTAYVADALVLRVLHHGSLRWDHALVGLRLFDAALVTPVALLTWAAVRRVTRSPRAAVFGALALFAVPQLASIGASVTNDAPVLLFGGLVVWLASRVLTGDLRRRTLLRLGVTLGVLVATKGTGLPAIPFVALVVLVGGAGAGGLSLAARLLRTAGTLAVAAALGAWWWVRNLVVFHTLQPDGYAAIRPDRPFPRVSTRRSRTSRTSASARSHAPSGAPRATGPGQHRRHAHRRADRRRPRRGARLGVPPRWDGDPGAVPGRLPRTPAAPADGQQRAGVPADDRGRGDAGPLRVPGDRVPRGPQRDRVATAPPDRCGADGDRAGPRRRSADGRAVGTRRRVRLVLERRTGAGVRRERRPLRGGRAGAVRGGRRPGGPGRRRTDRRRAAGVAGPAGAGQFPVPVPVTWITSTEQDCTGAPFSSEHTWYTGNVPTTGPMAE